MFALGRFLRKYDWDWYEASCHYNGGNHCGRKARRYGRIVSARASWLASEGERLREAVLSGLLCLDPTYGLLVPASTAESWEISCEISRYYVSLEYFDE